MKHVKRAPERNGYTHHGSLRNYQTKILYGCGDGASVALYTISAITDRCN